MMQMNLMAKMVAFFMLVVLVGAVGFGFVVYNMDVARELVTKTKQEDIPRLLQTAEIARNVENKFASLRGFLISGDRVSLDNFRRVTAENEKLEKELLAAARTEQGKKVVNELMALEGKYSEIAERVVIAHKQAGRDQEALQVMNGELTELGRQLRAKAKEYSELRREQIDTAMAKSVNAADAGEKAAVAAGLASALLGLLIGVFAARSISRPVNQLAMAAGKVADGDLTQQVRVTRQDEIGHLAASFNAMVVALTGLVRQITTNAEHLAASSEELTASADQSALAANQITGSITDVAAGATEQMQAVTETSAVVEEMSAGIQQIAANASEVAGQTARTAERAGDGRQAVERAVSQMKRIEQTVGASAAVVGRLGGRSQEIGQIVDAIAGIAGQTNLLALNAAIEAARAGEQGRGFAVVAEEVRKLAEQSEEAAKKIGSLIGEIREDTDRAVAAMNDGTREVKEGAEAVKTAGGAFGEIMEMVNVVSEQVRDISAAIEQMADGSQHIVTSVKKIDEHSKRSAAESQSVSAATEEQLASMEEIAGASQSLAKLAQELQAAVARFRV
jgi:methyl-accepting chemotaxis protein